MGQVFEEAAAELDSVRRRFGSNPQDLIVQFLLIALEREEIVSMAYRSSQIARRLSEMPISEDLRNLIGHAIIWIWKDEEMHAVYVRGALQRTGGFWLRWQAHLQQVGGALAGWATSVLHHTRWYRAPVSHGLGKLIVLSGALAGKVPTTVGKSLRYIPFRDFCSLNADLERASWMSWDQIAQLAEQNQFLVDMIPSFRQVAAEEIRHLHVFNAIADQLDAQDRAVSENAGDVLAGQIAEISDYLLARKRRGVSGHGNPLGSGGRVQCQVSTSLEPPRQALRRLVDTSELYATLGAKSISTGRPLSELRVVIKTCFMLAYHRRDPSPTVDPELIFELVDWLKDSGCREIVVAESRNIYDRYFGCRSVEEVATYVGLQETGFQIADLTEHQVPHLYERGMGQATVAAEWKAADFRISFGKTRSHPIEMALLSLGNLEGVGGRSDEFLFADKLAERTTALMMVLDEFPPDFAILDAFHNVPDGIVGMMGCPTPHHPRRLYAGKDSFAVDCVVARHLGMREPGDSPLLRAACHWFGGWPQAVHLVGDDTPIPGWRGPYSSEWYSLLSLLALPIYVGGSGRGSLFLPQMDPEAFPLLQRPSLWRRIGRALVRWIVGLRLP